MAIVLANVDQIKTSNGETLDIKAAVGATSSGGSGASADFVATGNIAAGQTVGLRADGTVEVITETITTGTQTESVGSPVVFGGNGYRPSVTFDSNTSKVVIAYQDVGNSSYGTAVVGTVSGNSIAFGTPVVFESADARWISVTFNSNTNKVVIAYTDQGNSEYGTAVVGEVSGNSINFGSPVLFVQNRTSYNSIIFDSNTNKVVIAYQDVDNSSYGTAIVGEVSGDSISFGTPAVFETSNSNNISATFDSNLKKVVIATSGAGGRAIVGEVSGNSISFGSPAVFDSAYPSDISTVFESSTNRVLIAYKDANYGKAVVGEVSGNAISFGTPIVFESAGIEYISATFDSNTNKVIIAYSDSGNSNYGTAVVGEVSGNAISFGTPVVFESSTNIAFTSATFDSNTNKVVIAYTDSGNPYRGTAIVYTPPGTVAITTTNASSWLGIANETVTSGSSGSVNLMGSVDANQSGLTTGEIYHLNYDGTLTDTPNEGPLIGTYGKVGMALSQTSIFLTK